MIDFKVELYWSTRSSRDSSRLPAIDDSDMSFSKDVAFMSLSLRCLTQIFTGHGRGMQSEPVITAWSEGSWNEVLMLVTKSSKHLVITRSSVWPCLWVDESICCFKSNWARRLNSRTPSWSAGLSTWMLKSPTIRILPGCTTISSRIFENSSRKRRKEWSRPRLGGGLYITTIRMETGPDGRV